MGSLFTRAIVALAIIASPAVLLAADNPKPAPAEPKTVLVQRGPVLKEEDFSVADRIKDKKAWFIYKGDFSVQDGALRVVERAEDGHHPAMSTKVPMKDAILQCRFRVDQGKWLGLSLDDGKKKEHIFRAMINANGLSLKQMSGMGKTTKGVNIAEQKFKFDPAKWYTLVVELKGAEVVATIPEANISIRGKSDGVNVDKDRFELISGGGAVWFDDVKIYEAK
jgi:hypothetical protein